MLVWSGVEGHPGIAKFLGFCTNFKYSEAWLISPWEPYGNVSDFVRGRELEVPEKLSLVSVTSIATCAVLLELDTLYRSTTR